MSNTKLQNLRGFLTERFTTVAVEIFGEIETIVEAYYEENKRLRNVLHMVLNPEIKLPRIDVSSQYTGATTDVREQHPDLNTRADLETSEPLAKKPKEEEIEYDISLGSEQQHGLGEAEHFIAPDCVKNDPEEEDARMLCIAETFHIKMDECDPQSSGTLSADEDDDCSASDSERLTDLPQLSRSEESSSGSREPQKHDILSADEDCSASDSERLTDFPQLSRSKESSSGSREPQKHDIKSGKSLTKWKKPKWSLQKTMLELPRMVPQQCFIPAPNDCQSFLARLTEAFKDFPDDKKPLITKMGLTENVELVDCAFGKVPKGSPLSYQCPVPSGQDYKTHDDAPPRPLLPRSSHKLEVMLPSRSLNAKEAEHMEVMEITWEDARSLEHSTRGSEEAVEELRKLRLTSHFREICKLKPGRSNAKLLIFKMQKGLSRRKTAQIEKQMKAEALREYCNHLCVNWSPCGLVVHPNAPWLGALPDGLVYDPKEKPSFGLVHVKCTRFRSFIECGFLFCQDGVLQLKKSHSHYWHIQGEMMVTGTEWCDLLVFSKDDILVQRIYRDLVVINVMKKKLDNFFFQFYLPCLL
ncbi:hypothetical protein PFLUV_G00041840 [Perca fluviatilis]|uniref:YqaJ viral recombinase domain-containing protein n=1 Tax=Perca fluviatilis TaxID=8168 RepID=A0A6A5EQ36_PERFL|nr:uncharacterized protein LOC120557863 [Perca fluviatilis]KAF1391411.1 hypothetical protein PFLUV_G00041840 [Perca fluviatilis]